VSALQREWKQRVAVRRQRPRGVGESGHPRRVVPGADVVDAREHVHSAHRQRRTRRALEQPRQLGQCRVERDLARDRREPRELVERALPRE